MPPNIQPKPLVLTMGEPAGISSEITVKAWHHFSQTNPVMGCFFIIDDPERYNHYSIPIDIIDDPVDAFNNFHSALPVLPLPGKVSDIPGTPDPKTATHIITSIKMAVNFCLSQETAALVTNPIEKSNMPHGGFTFPGHTEFLGDATKHALLPPLKSGNKRERGPVMMLAGPELRTVPITVHQSLSSVSQTLTTDKIIEVATVTAQSLKVEFQIENPRLAIAGLNPHSGEGGLFGHEDIEIIAPAIKILQENGIDAVGPIPADTMFHRAARTRYDAALCMYHDQALIPVKTLDFDRTVNVTLGLPIIRTSPDHGTALDIAGKNIARPDSLIASITLARQLADNVAKAKS